MGRTGGREKAGSWCTEARLCVAVVVLTGKENAMRSAGSLLPSSMIGPPKPSPTFLWRSGHPTEMEAYAASVLG